MQIKPYFKEYKELSRTFFKVDDLGNTYDLINYEGIKKDNGKKVSGWRVLSNRLEIYSSGATGYEEDLFFENKKNAFSIGYKPIFIKNFKIFPVYVGPTGLIKNGVIVRCIVEKATIFESILIFLNLVFVIKNKIKLYFENRAIRNKLKKYANTIRKNDERAKIS